MKKFVFILLCCLLAIQTVSAEVVERIVAIVNSEIITLTDVNQFKEKLRSSTFLDDLLIPDEKTKQELLKDQDKLVQTMIDQKLIDSEIKRQGLMAPIERVEEKIREIARANNLSREELKQALKERGESFSQYQEFIKTSLERQALIEKSITSKIRISDDDVMAYYLSQNTSADNQIFEYSLSHILLLPSKNGKQAARERAEFVLSKLKGGADFEKLASEYSEDPNYSAGGILGTFKSGEFLKELESAVEKIGVGDYTGIVQTSSGFHIVKVLKKRPVPNPDFEKQKEKIRTLLFERAYKKQFKTWLEQVRQESFIRINEK